MCMFNIILLTWEVQSSGCERRAAHTCTYVYSVIKQIHKHISDTVERTLVVTFAGRTFLETHAFGTLSSSLHVHGLGIGLRSTRALSAEMIGNEFSQW